MYYGQQKRLSLCQPQPMLCVLQIDNTTGIALQPGEEFQNVCITEGRISRTPAWSKP